MYVSCYSIHRPSGWIEHVSNSTLEAYSNANAEWMRQTTADFTHVNINKQAVSAVSMSWDTTKTYDGRGVTWGARRQRPDGQR